MKKGVDEKDLIILAELEQNSRLSEKKLAVRTHIPMTTVHNRLQQLRQAGIIKKYTIAMDHEKLGKTILAYVLVKASPQTDHRQLLHQISRIPSVQETSMVTGEFDIIFKIRVRSMGELQGIVVENLRKQKQVNETLTLISYETID